MFGSVIADINCIFQSGFISTALRPLVASRTSPSAVVIELPSILGQQFVDVSCNHVDHPLLEGCRCG